MRIDTLKETVTKSIAAISSQALALSRSLHAEPEQAWEEYKSVDKVAGAFVRDARFRVSERAGGVETAFIAQVGSGSLHLTICAEYDALPGIGHACGHNVIAASAVAAGLSLADLVDELDLTVKIIGTPAEERGGGKIQLLDAGVFDDTHLAMLVHPAAQDADRMHCLARASYDAHYQGVSAHASAAPERGVNAGDAVTVAQVALGLLRQHLRPYDQVHGIVTKGGDAANIVPDHTIYSGQVRSRDLSSLRALQSRVEDALEAGARATGCTITIHHEGKPYSEFFDDEDSVAIFRKNFERLGRRVPSPHRPRAPLLPHDGAGAMSASTDLANVSLKIPCIHPMVGIDARGATNHEPDFAAASVSRSAEVALLDGAAAMAMTVIDLATQESQRVRLMHDVWPR